MFSDWHEGKGLGYTFTFSYIVDFVDYFIHTLLDNGVNEENGDRKKLSDYTEIGNDFKDFLSEQKNDIATMFSKWHIERDFGYTYAYDHILNFLNYSIHTLWNV